VANNKANTEVEKHTMNDRYTHGWLQSNATRQRSSNRSLKGHMRSWTHNTQICAGLRERRSLCQRVLFLSISLATASTVIQRWIYGRGAWALAYLPQTVLCY